MLDKIRSNLLKKGSPIPPILLLFAIISILILALSVMHSGPEIDDINPDIGLPGDIITITGRHFGDDKGIVHFGEVFPLDAEYLSWTDREIKVVIPKDAPSGALWIENSVGTSPIEIFTNRIHLPIVAQGPRRPGEPYIEDINPHRGGPGDIITIVGGNFGDSREASQVLFPWISRQDGVNLQPFGSDYTIGASEVEEDYIAWSNEEIRVRVPDGAASGNIFVSGEKGQSNSSYLEVSDEAGVRVLSHKRSYNLQISAIAREVRALGDNQFDIWLPTGLETASQRNLQITNQVPTSVQQIPGFSRFSFQNVTEGKIYGASQDILIDTYRVESNIDPQKVSWNFDVNSYVYKNYTKQEPGLAVNHPSFPPISRVVIGRNRNPYWAAEKVYKYLLDKFQYESGPDKDLMSAVYSKRANALTLSRIFVTLMRISRLPARVVSGVVIDSQNQARVHYWAEYYISDFGWVPVDVAAGFNSFRVLGRHIEDNRNFFFGGITEYHIAFSKGIMDIPKVHQNSIVRDSRNIPYSMQSIAEEFTGNIQSYSLLWGDIAVIGIY